MSENPRRRYLNLAQRASIGAAAQNWAMAAQKGAALGNQNAVAKQMARTNHSFSGPVLTTTAQRAEQSGVSLSTQKRADAIAKADSDLAKEVAHGKLTPPRGGAAARAFPHVGAI